MSYHVISCIISCHIIYHISYFIFHISYIIFHISYIINHIIIIEAKPQRWTFTAHDRNSLGSAVAGNRMKEWTSPHYQVVATQISQVFLPRFFWGDDMILFDERAYFEKKGSFKTPTRLIERHGFHMTNLPVEPSHITRFQKVVFCSWRQ